MYIAGILNSNPLSPDTDYFLLYMILHWCPRSKSVPVNFFWDRGQHFHFWMNSVPKLNSVPDANICMLLLVLDRKHSDVSKTV